MKGTYTLILQAKHNFQITAGKLGILKGQSGYYIYSGSAFGPGGVRARTGHHMKKSPKPHWHIDYLREKADILEIWYTNDPTRREHQWVDLILSQMDGSIPFPGFGSSDCSCISHLIHIQQKPSIGRFRRIIHKSIQKHAPIRNLT